MLSVVEKVVKCVTWYWMERESMEKEADFFDLLIYVREITVVSFVPSCFIFKYFQTIHFSIHPASVFYRSGYKEGFSFREEKEIH